MTAQGRGSAKAVSRRLSNTRTGKSVRGYIARFRKDDAAGRQAGRQAGGEGERQPGAGEDGGRKLWQDLSVPGVRNVRVAGGREPCSVAVVVALQRRGVGEGAE